MSGPMTGGASALLRVVALLSAATSLGLAPVPMQVPVAAPSDYWGVSLGLHPELAESHALDFPPDVAPLPGLGVRAVLLPVSRAQRDVGSSALLSGTDSVSASQLARVAAASHGRGLHTALMPFVRLQRGPVTDWRGRLSPQDVDAWFASYAAFILEQAAVAQRAGIGMLVVGSELSSLSSERHAPQWAWLCAEVRRVYPGLLAFVVNHDALDATAAAPYVDVIGVSAYFPLARQAGADPSTMARAWGRASQRLAGLQQRVDRPLVLFEVGYPSRAGGAVRPWDDTVGTPVDVVEQRRAYAAAVDALLSAPHISGALFWTWLGPGGSYDRHYTPRGKPAMGELRRLLSQRGPGWRRAVSRGG